MIRQDYTKEISLKSGQQKIVPWPRALLVLAGLAILTGLVIYALNHAAPVRDHSVPANSSLAASPPTAPKSFWK